MSALRVLPLFDPNARPQSWNERMAEGEFAALYSGAVVGGPDVNTCAVFGSQAEAEAYAREQVQAHTALRCRVYTHEGLGAEPVLDVKGTDFKGERELTAKMRRWIGGIFLFGGIVLFLVDRNANYAMLWPAILAARMIPVGLFLLAIELVLLILRRRERRVA